MVMVADPLLILFILVFGCAAFFLGLFYLVGQVLGFFGRGICRLLRGGSPQGPSSSLSPGSALVCPRASCGHLERRVARYCSQCGTRLGDLEHTASS